MPTRHPLLLTIVRIIVGLLFIVSGAIKANDPLGMAYKLEEYFEVLHIPFFIQFAVPIAIILVVSEMVLGFALLIGYKPKLVTSLLLAMIVFFTFLTFYSAYFNKVTDCGCFGDAIKLTPWESFSKDVVLTIMIVYLFLNHRKIRSWLSERGQAATLTVATIAFIALPVLTYSTLPLIDFRPYKAGNNLPALMKVPEGGVTDSFASVMIYANKQSGQKQEFAITNLPDDSLWEWKETNTVKVREGDEAEIHDFTITTAQGDEFTDDFLQAPATLFVIARQLPRSHAKAFAQLQELYQFSKAKGVRMAALTASTPQDVQETVAKHALGFPFYYTDGTVLKAMNRSNPGLILLKNGTVVKHWHARNLPTQAELAELLGQKQPG